MKQDVRMQRHSANDDVVKIVELYFEDKSFVNEGEVILSVEGEKAVYDIESPFSGYLQYLFKVDQNVKVDDCIAYIYSELNFFEDFSTEDSFEISDKNILLEDSFVNEKRIIDKSYFKDKSEPRRIAVIGGGAGLAQILDVTRKSNKLNVVCCYDDVLFKDEKSSFNVPVVGPVFSSTIINDFHGDLFDSIIISVSTNIAFRKRIYEELSSNIPFCNIIHQSASISNEASIGYGNIILANTHIGFEAKLGNNNFISSFCNIEHHCIVGDHCTFGPNVIFSGFVFVDSEVKFGTGIHVEPKQKISGNQFIKSGTLIRM